MRNALRWVGFTVGAALIGLAMAFALLFAGRLYMGLNQAAFVFSVLMVYCIGLTIAAISFAARLEEEQVQAELAAAQRAAAARLADPDAVTD